MVEITVTGLLIDETNTGLDTLGIVYVSTLDVTQFTFNDITMKQVSNFLYSENTKIEINGLDFSNIITVKQPFSTTMEVPYIMILSESSLIMNNGDIDNTELFAIYSTNIE